MVAGILTRLQILQEGTKSGGNASLASTGGRAQTFLDLLLDHLYRKDDLPFLRKITTVTADSVDFSKIPGSALPADYGRIQRLRARGVKANSWLKQWNQIEDLWLQRQIDSENNVAAVVCPFKFGIDEGANVNALPDIYVWPLPSARLSYDLIYYRKPAILASDNSIPEWPDHAGLVKAVEAFTMRWQRDTMAAIAQQETDRLYAEFKANMADVGRSDSLDLRFDGVTFPSYKAD